ncbi:MRC1-like domain-containing protein [Triangularia setosa]|uniref:MRC1-like domain-containing protein n=1 Tax=Triangularia setosa TaxID=2587417 RepID=A0AAN7A928_9PEZI|nr:MRC1-like domain-containing protein [Podospora setosa]
MHSSPAVSRQSGSATPSASPATTRIRSDNRFLNFAGDSSSSEGEDDEEILRPRGKLAARMLGGNTEPTEDSESEKSSPNSPSLKKTSEVQEAENDDDDEDEIITTRPRKLKARRPRSTTSEPQPRATRPRSPSPEKSSSPAPQELFVSPSKPTGEAESDDKDLLSPSRLARNAKFETLVAKKRAERLAREAEEARKKAERNVSAMIADDENPEDFTDDEGGQKLTQDGAKSRPSARKASKKALEEMNRETQRMTRALQLAHEAKVKKKIPKSMLFERFNFKPAGAAASTEAPKEEAAPVSSSRAGTPASVQQSDAEPKEDGTPPSSPPEGEKEKAAPVSQTILEDSNDDGLLTADEMAALAAAAPKKLVKGKGEATAADFEAEDKEAKEQQHLARVKCNLRVKFPQLPVQANTATVILDDEDDDDLRIQKPSKIDEILSRVNPNQNKEPKALHNLRRLAQLDDPDKKAGPVPTKQKFQQHQKSAMTVGELQMNLMQRAKAQAKLERERHLETLRAKGIVVMTAEEREKEEQEVEDIVAKARREAEEIMAREREDAKQERRKKRLENGEDPLDWDDSDYDGDSWIGEDEEEPEIELSGSEEENGEEDEEMEEGGVLIDGAAEDSADEEAEEAKVPNSDDENGLPTGSSKQTHRRARKQTVVLSDDEEEVDEGVVKATPNPKKILAKSPSVRQHTSPSVPTSVLRSATKTFIPGLPVAGPAGLGLTQIFQGTMDDSQMGSALADSPSQPRPTFDMGVFPDSQFSQSVEEPAEDVIMNSQPAAGEQDAETQGIQIQFSQSQVHGFDSFLRDDTFEATQGSELIEPTQDSGFKNFSPLRRSFVEEPTSTVETLPADQSSQVADSPLVRRTGKLRRRAEVAVSENEDADETMEDNLETGAASASNAFSAMKEAARKEKERKKKEAFDKKKSKAREMVEEQAEESEDEYAGLGGADGEDSDDEDAQSVQEMIDDETTDKAEDERKLAAFYADRERASDEKQVNKLFHDITTGLLRRKRAGNWDELDDEDDGGETLRRMKRRQFAKMQRALFADERISKVAENPRNQAFLKTIEDRGSDDEMDFIWAPPPAAPGLDSQHSTTGGDSSNEAVTIPDSQSQPQQQSTNPRRTKPGLTNKKKPANIGEIRESLSNLLDDGPRYNSSSAIPATILDSDSEGEEAPPPSSASSNKENSKPQIVDRISLKRTSSNTSTSRFAFAGSSDRSSSFKIPPLLRRATTNSSTLSASSMGMSSTGVTTSNLQQVRAEDGGIKIKQTASKKSGVSYLARGNERLASLAEKEKRREEKKFKGAMAGERKKALGGMFGGGRFE